MIQPFQQIVAVCLLGLLIWVIWHKQGRNSELKFFFWPALLLKVFCGLLIGVFYKGLDDTFEFQWVGEMMKNYSLRSFSGYISLLWDNNLSGFDEMRCIDFKPFNNSFFLAKILSILNFISGNSYWLNSLFLSLFSFSGCWFFISKSKLAFPKGQIAGIIAFFFFPSIAFWSSGIMKEAVLLGSLGFFWGAVLKLTFLKPQSKINVFVLLSINAWLLWKIRFFLAVLVFCLTGTWLLIHFANSHFKINRKQKMVLFFLPVLSSVIALIFIQVSGTFDLNYLFRHLVWDYEEILRLSLNRPNIQYDNFEPTLISALKNTPYAVFSCFFRPFLGESTAPLYLAAGIENMVLMVITVLASFKLKIESLRWPNAFYLMLIAFILITAILMSLPMPNLGTLNRYRVAFLPFGLYLILQTPFWNSVLLKISKVFKSE